MKRKQIITYAASGVGVVLFLAASGLLVRNIMQYREKEQDFNRLRSRLTQLYRSEVFPSDENVALERENREQLETWFERLITKLGEENISRADRSPPQFVERLELSRNTLRRQANRSRIRLPDAGTDFAFGFERYAGTGLLPSLEDVPRLTEQLIIVTRLVRLMYESEITALSAIRRDVFEEETAAEEPRSREPASGRRGAAPVRGRTPDRTRAVRSPRQPGVLGAEDMFATYRFVFEFSAREEALTKLLNALAANPMYTVVRTIRLRKDVPSMVPTQAEGTGADRRPQSSETDVSFLFGGGEEATQEPGAAPTPLLGTSRPVSGIEMETPMQVRLEVDVYKFRSVDETRD